MDPTGPGETAAHCALHRDRPAADICGRCGAFMCEECNQHGTATLCPACRSKVQGPAEGFPLSRDRWSLGELFDLAWRGFSREWLMLGVASLIFYAVIAGFWLAGQLAEAAASLAGTRAVVALAIGRGLVQMALQGALQLGFYRMSVDVLLGRKAELGVLFGQFHKLGKLLLQLLLVALAIGVPALLWAGIGVAVSAALHHAHPYLVAGATFAVGIVPFVWWATPFALAQMELAVDDEAGPLGSLQSCFAIAHGQRLALLGITFLASLIMGAGALACCVGVLASLPFGELVTVGLFLALRRGSEAGPKAPAGEPGGVPLAG